MNSSILWSFLWRVCLILSVPFLTLRRAMAASPIADMVRDYPLELIFFAAMMCLILGALLGTFYPVPEEVEARPMGRGLKFLVSVSFGVAAFIYVVSVDKTLTLVNPLWVGGVAFIAPAIVEIMRAWLIKAVRSRLGG